VLETRRGVGSFVSTAPGAARSAAEHTRRLRAFVTRLLADAAAAGFTHEEILAELEDRK
jgi:DNA-binding transcriptional regulator YhcF (GntR family)